jgi:hypothetical protein
MFETLAASNTVISVSSRSVISHFVLEELLSLLYLVVPEDQVSIPGWTQRGRRERSN